MEKELPVRKRIRLKGYDYSNEGYYFITICTHGQQYLLCNVITANVGQGLCSCCLLEAGKIVKAELFELKKRYNHIRIDKYVIMPNHIHMIIAVERREQSPRPTILDIICTYKSITTKRYNKTLGKTGKTLWQSRYHDHIIRNEAEYQLIWQYIDENPIRWKRTYTMLKEPGMII